MAEVDVQAMDRRVKWWLLGASLATLAVLIACALQENVYPQWRSTRIEYARILDEKASDAGGRMIADRFEIDPDQHVLPDLARVDRCITCHTGLDDERMSNEEQPFRTHPGDLLALHPPERYGCTICHLGQGSATELPDAHGNVPFWPEPMIPVQYAYAGCGSCHVPLGVADLSVLWQGRNLLERYDCLACHRIDGRGGTIRPGGAGGMEGPELSHIGARGFDAGWYEEHLKRREEAEDGPWEISFGSLDRQDREMIEAFLISRVGAPELVEAKALFHSLGCRGCHKIRGVGGDDGPDLTLFAEKDPRQIDFSRVAGERTLANWLAQHLPQPARVVEGSQMPDMGLSESQIEELTLYMLSLRHRDVPERFCPNDRILVERLQRREFATDGATLYAAFCGGCHGSVGEGIRYAGATPFPSVANADFLAVATDEFIAETIRSGRPGRRMPAWNESQGGLRESEITKIVARLRHLGGVPEPRVEAAESRWVRADAAAGERLFATHCAGCHGPQGDSRDAPQLNNKALLAAAGDTYLVETIGRGRRGTAMPGFRNPSPAYPTLSHPQIQSIVAFIRTWEEPAK
jgi:mono/diheme cytochrome c family protein